MPKISNNNDPLLERAIFAFDGTDYRVVSVNSSGQLVAALASGSTIKVTQDTAANLLATVNLATDQNVQARAHGYDGSNWRKLQLLWAYTDRLQEEVLTTNASAGQNLLVSTAVAAGYVHVVQAFSMANFTTSAGRHLIQMPFATNQTTLIDVAAPAIGVRTCWYGEVVLKEGDTIRANFTSCTAGDDLYLNLWGYKMKIND